MPSLPSLTRLGSLGSAYLEPPRLRHGGLWNAFWMESITSRVDGNGFHVTALIEVSDGFSLGFQAVNHDILGTAIPPAFPLYN